ncbi:unnamed protein product [Clonostachys byssicola]|uniref:Uncharacterized protein n=1 Tax=Clonostachys byssicola TaxID=160290 RepID=A0A9N9UK68_9HYPO|nr:unnamed protein product [Clonostachys byssicola]
MASDHVFPATTTRDSYNGFLILACLGLFSQWAIMIMNGSLRLMLLTAWTSIFPDGIPLREEWTRMWIVDVALRVLVAFFGAILNVVESHEFGPYLCLVDLITTIVVFGMMFLVEDRRDRGKGALRYPTCWQLLLYFFGAASIVPIYMRLYLKDRLSLRLQVPHNQARALPFTALWCSVLSLPLLLPVALGANLSQIQVGIVVWLFSPATVGPFQDLLSTLMSKSNDVRSSTKEAAQSIAIAYGILGVFSAIVHVSVVVFTFVSSNLGWSDIYWPIHGVRSGPSLMTDGALIFIQSGYFSLSICVLALGYFLLKTENLPATHSLLGSSHGWKALLVHTVLIAVFGPGAALALLLGSKEITTASTIALRKGN